MARYCFYVDGFNMYHALQEGYPQYKWLNYRRLAEAAVLARDTIESVVYFTAFTYWKALQVNRHKVYVKALRWAGVEVVQGRFMRKTATCHRCHRTYVTHEEKRTDVNIAVRVLSDAVADSYDRAVVVSADSDLLPVVKATHEIAPGKEIGIMFPIGRSSVDLKIHADFTRKMPQSLLRASQLPDEIPLGSTTIRKPISWP